VPESKPVTEINTILMESTFMLSGPAATPGQQTIGTCFVMFRQRSADSNQGRYVLITARHVLDDIVGDSATVGIRKRNSAGIVEKASMPLPIRRNGVALYTVHPSEDVAAIDVALPNDSIIVQMGGSITNILWLANDAFLKQIEIHPGDELFCLGYPLGLQSSDAGYPVLRSGKIASYPIVPLKESKKILFDFLVFPGNSGGPVYFSYSNRMYNDTFNMGTTHQKIFGLVVQKANPVSAIDPLIGIIIPSVYIKETIDRLAGFESNLTEPQANP
jgi:hypothetical protein